MTESATGRKVVAIVGLSFDGFSTSPGGDLNWLIEHVSHDRPRPALGASTTPWAAGAGFAAITEHQEADR
jgi:hypothetical protein